MDKQIRRLAVLLIAAALMVLAPAAVAAESDAAAGGAATANSGSIAAEASAADDLGDNDELLMEYMKKQVSDETGIAFDGDEVTESRGLSAKANPTTRRSSLGETEGAFYDALLTRINALINQTEEAPVESTVFYVPFSEISTVETVNEDADVDGDTVHLTHKMTKADYEKIVSGNTFAFDFEKMVGALQADQPYAMFWFDKTIQFEATTNFDSTYNVSGDENYDYFAGEPAVIFTFRVAKAYSKTDEAGTTDVNPAKIIAARTAALNAANIIESNKDKPNRQKLQTYKNKICELVSYDEDALAEGTPYGDPWQMIYVFDGNASTNVVCEGYSKAFQFLCDGSSFTSDIECDTVTGNMKSPEEISEVSGEGPHMWNILHMDDGKNYIADITNSDDGTIGEGGALFLKGALSGGSVASYYDYDCLDTEGADIRYTYDSETKGLFTVDELTMSTDDYPDDYVTAVSVEFTPASASTYEGYIGEDKLKKFPLPGDSFTVTLSDGSTETYTAVEGDENDFSFSGDGTPKVAISEVGLEFTGEQTEFVAGENTLVFTCQIEETGISLSDSTGIRVTGICREHSLAHHPAKAATGHSTGNIEYWKCSRCDKCFSDAGAGTEINEADTVIPVDEEMRKQEEAAKREAEAKAAADAAAAEAARLGTQTAGLPKIKISKPKAAKKSITVKWKKLTKKQLKKSGTTNIEIWVATDSGFSGVVASPMVGKKKASAKIKGLAKGTYWVKVRAVRNVGGVKYYTSWSKVKKVKVKK